jgi:thioredoxin reductase (NADPH)
MVLFQKMLNIRMNKIQLYGADWCPDCRRAKVYLKENKITFDFIDVDIDEEATKKVEFINKGKRIIPTIIINEISYTNPSNDELASVLGINENHRIVLFGADWCPDCRKSKSFLTDNNINYQFIDTDKNEWAIPIITKINNGKRKIPTIIINDDIVLVEPENEELRQVLKIDEVKEERTFDAIIIGGGAAGLTTSIYAQRDRFNTLILEKKTIGGNAFLTKKIENYPGFTSISGPALMDKMEEQAKTYGAVIKTGEDVISIERVKDLIKVNTSSKSYLGKSIVLATGSTYRKLDIPGESELIGSGVHFCATCDGAFYREKDIIVVGGGNSALEEGIFLAGFCKSVKIVHWQSKFSASETYIEKLASIKNITTYMNKTSQEFISDVDVLFKGLRIEDNSTKNQEVLIADGVFIFIGLIPNTRAFKDLVELNEGGFIKTSGLAQTSQKGIFAAGDCREGAIAQVAAATGEGVLASYGLRDFLK